MDSGNKTLLGIALVLISGFMLASHDAVSKYMSSLYPVLFVIWARYLSQSVLMAVLFGGHMRLNLVRTRRPLLQLLRGLSLVGISILFFNALRFLPLGEATAVMFTSPLFVILLSAVFLKEWVSWPLWLSVICGLIGVLIIVRPGGELFSWSVLLPLGAALCFAVYQLLTRRLAHTDHPVTSNFLSSLLGVAVMSVPAWMYWASPPLPDVAWLFLLGILATCGHILLTQGLRHASAATVAPFTYMQIVFAALLGWMVFGHVPDQGALLGMLVVLGSGLLSVMGRDRH